MAILTHYHRPTEMDEALALLARTDVHLVPLAGGTALIPALETRELREVEGVVDLSRLGLEAIQADGDGIRIGAMVRLTDLMEHPTTGTLADGLLRRTAACEGPINLRNMATVGGTVVTAHPDSELYAAFLALDAQVHFRDAQGEHRIPLAAFQGLEQGLVIALHLSPGQDLRGGHARVARTPRDRPIVAAVAVVGEGVERVALCGVASRPVLADAPLAPPDDCTGTPEYRQAMAQVLSRRALAQARS